MGRKARQQRCRAIIINYQNQIINIELNENECLKNKNDLDNLPIIRKRRKSNKKNIINKIKKNEPPNDKINETEESHPNSITDKKQITSFFDDINFNDQEFDDFNDWY